MEFQKLLLFGFFLIGGILLFIAGRAWQQNNIAFKMSISSTRADITFVASIILYALCLLFFSVVLFNPSSFFIKL